MPEYRGREDVLVHTPIETSTREIGWTITPTRQGRGYGVEAATALMDLAFDTLGLRRVTAVIDDRNLASLALARRLGMRQEARRVEAVWMRGAWATVTDWAMLASERGSVQA